jgi:hypothetical protein
LAESYLRTTKIGQLVNEGGRPPYLLYSQIYQVLVSELGKEFANLFAKPVYEDGGNEIDWYAISDAGIYRYNDLTKDEKIVFDDEVLRLQDQIRVLAETYASSEQLGKKSIGFALKAGLSTKSFENYFLCGNQPVITFWGFVKNESENKYVSIKNNLSEEKEQRKKATYQASNNIDPLVGNTYALKLELINKILRFSAQLVWGTIGFLLISICILITLYLTGNWLGTKQGLSLPFIIEDEEEITLFNKLERANVEEESLRAEYDLLNYELKSQQCNCTQNKLIEKGSLIIPRAAVKNNDLSFLEGKWQSITGMVDTLNSQPIILEYKFNKKGQGVARVVEESGTVCSANALATLSSSGILTIQDDAPLECDGNNARYKPSVITCTISSVGEAECKGLQNSSSYSVVIKRKN